MSPLNGPKIIERWEDFPDAIIAAERAGAIGLAHLTRAMLAGRIAFWPLQQETSVTGLKEFQRGSTNHPAVLLIGDDDYQNRGPTRWKVAGRAIRWSRFVLVHAAGAKPEHYQSAVEAAQIVKRVLVIEASFATLHDWTMLVRRAPHGPATMVIRPDNGAHPVMPRLAS
jgi:hypothetical protein